MKKFLALSLSNVVFIMLINVKISTMVGILTFMSRINFLFSWVEHGKSFITSRPGKGTALDISYISTKTYVGGAQKNSLF